MATKFAKSVQASTKRTLARVNKACYQIAAELFKSVVELTPSPSNPGPYAIGHLANQWYPSDDGDFSDELSSDTSDSGAGSLSRIATMRGYAFFGRDGIATLANNLSYAYRAEALGWTQKDGWSGTIGPYRMVARSIQIIQSRYK